MMTEEKFKKFVIKELFSLLVLNVVFIPFPHEYPYEIKLLLTTLIFWLFPKSVDTWIDQLKPPVYWSMFTLFVVIEVLAAIKLFGPSILS